MACNARWPRLDERQRAKLSSPPQKLFAQLIKNKAGAGASDRLKAFSPGEAATSGNIGIPGRTDYATLALFAVGPLSAVKKRDVHVWHEGHDVLDRIMRDRRPEWIDDWIAFELEQEFATLRFRRFCDPG